jgi:hypothetical protein
VGSSSLKFTIDKPTKKYTKSSKEQIKDREFEIFVSKVGKNGK